MAQIMFDLSFVLLVEQNPKLSWTKLIWIVELRIVEHPNVPHLWLVKLVQFDPISRLITLIVIA